MKLNKAKVFFLISIVFASIITLIYFFFLLQKLMQFIKGAIT